MRALLLAGAGGVEQLAVRNVPPPALIAPDEVRVRIHAAALNRLDLFVLHGMPGVPPAYPHIPGSDGAGAVTEVGPAVNGLRPGDRVMINPGLSCGRCPRCLAGDEPLCDRFHILGEHLSGTLADEVVLPAANLAPVPATMSWAEAAAFPLATLTAWRMLVTRARLRPGESVLIWGAGGGVAQAAIRIARHLGARVAATSRSDAKLALARRLGADFAVNHVTEDVVAAVRRFAGGRGVDVVVDSVGAATWPRSLRLLDRAGRLVVCGATSGPEVGLDARRLFWHQWSILGSTMGSHREFAEISALAAQGHLWPVVDSVTPLERAAEAFDRLARGDQSGKLVIEVTR